MQQQATEQAPLRFLKAREMCKKLSVSRSKLYELVDQDPSFPRPFKDGDSLQAPNYWIEHEVDQWMRQRLERARRG
ncbi:helix-turn-helix transcriptional regulator [Halomonas caseinilytica]